MWFKQVQIFQLTTAISSSAAALSDKLAALAFKSCLPSMPSSVGWVSPLGEEDAPLARGMNGCLMFSLQIEEKILPASVVNQALKEKVKKVEANEARKMRQKEKLSLKDEITHTLLPRAFSKLTVLNAYIDTRHQWLILNTLSPAKTEMFMSMFKKSLGECVASFELIKPSSLMTAWLKTGDYPRLFSIEKACVLQDPREQTRVIRCQQQDLRSYLDRNRTH